ncbi:MAG: NUDIX domain-containing protein [Gemmatimonadetes bacterium]|nr:NUDIX domain-containing protein [Gemmatimonadota bacterium]
MAEETRVERSAGGVVYRWGPAGVELLVIRDGYGNWGLPKGHVEGEEDPLQAALRECEEEAGLASLVPRGSVGTIDWYFRRAGRLIHKFCDFYLLEAPAGAEPHPQRDEGISEAVWLLAEAALERITYENTRELGRRAVRELLRVRPKRAESPREDEP